MNLVNAPRLFKAAEEYSKYSTLLVSFYSLMKEVKLDNAFQLTSIFPDAIEQGQPGKWLIPLAVGKLYVTAGIDFRYALISITSVSTTQS
ncbi:hypothetical protein [Enterobacter hormaechei]|uniref:hypothetical protein n=1 Tax=Enterobacter hormaechei TaxID=158836 RepID=UPI0026EF49AE|nr:hypothetical protein [Enterobacter hormaechei]